MKRLPPNRREFLRHAACAAVGTVAIRSTLWDLRLVKAAAPTVVIDYKALVCIFLVGGNDANNMIIPHEQAEYDAYAAVRTTASGINIARDTLLQIRPPSLNRRPKPAMRRAH